MNLGSFASMGSFWRVIREFNPEGIEREASAPVSILIAGAPGAGKRTLATALVGRGTEAGSHSFQIEDVSQDEAFVPPDYEPDLVILVERIDADPVQAGRRAAAAFGGSRAPKLLVFTHADLQEVTRDRRNEAYLAFSFVPHLQTFFLDARDASSVQATLVPPILELLPHLRMPLARLVPSARELVAQEIIAESCKVNAQFALVSNLPANIPFIGGVAGNVTDLIVLTKNQVMMVFRLAALYGRDISMTASVAAEIAPVIGGAFAWRTAARMAVGMLPTFLAAAPKTAVAYVGTYVVGQTARFYYAEGYRPSRQHLKSFSAEGGRLYSRVTGLFSKEKGA